MTHLRQESIKTLQEFLNFAAGLRTSCKSAWFRGTSDSGHALVPSMFRHPNCRTPEEYAKLEIEVIDRFKQRSIPFHDRRLVDSWDSLFFMQHYGVPTRLLDWTENPLFALYFAVAYSTRTTAGSDAAVWALDPSSWNQIALAHQSYKGGPLGPSAEELSGYAASPKWTNMNVLPVAMYGAHNSPRIVAQRGVFTIFGQDPTPMETAYSSRSEFPAGTLIKLVIPSDSVAQLRTDVFSFGVTHSTVFPDLDGLAREIRAFSGFEG
ncbi:MAG: FRG domain-containing protein [Planctomycetes bacterium]|nr:FRG domain-containing protein [Planctomycetota bacterium]